MIFDWKKQEFSYPALREIIINTPDYTGKFLRGQGGNAAAIGNIQEDAGRNITGYFGFDVNGFATVWSNTAIYAYSMRTATTVSTTNSVLKLNDPWKWLRQVGLNASREYGSTHTANEFRPINMTVRYLIRTRS